MESRAFTELSDEDLLKRLKSIRAQKIIDALVVGVTVGISIYSAVENGLGFFTLFPLVLTFLIVRNSANNKILERELQKESDFRSLR